MPSENIIDINTRTFFKNLEQKLDAQASTGDGNGEPPYDGGMEQRVAVLEAKLDHIEKEVSATKWWVAGSTVTIVLTMIATVLGTGVAIQQMTVATFQAAGAQAAQPAPQPAPIIINIPSQPATPTK